MRRPNEPPDAPPEGPEPPHPRAPGSVHPTPTADDDAELGREALRRRQREAGEELPPRQRIGYPPGRPVSGCAEGVSAPNAAAARSLPTDGEQDEPPRRGSGNHPRRFHVTRGRAFAVTLTTGQPRAPRRV